ncbi:hypothetical protein, partial [Bradyrhizobium sp. STM 3809]|uniref:hypothetical protein n=1 Tax=Bradyrhizobium sp. STM 3809 TaxID=551936 RepID=UPI001AEBC49C
DIVMTNGNAWKHRARIGARHVTTDAIGHPRGCKIQKALFSRAPQPQRSECRLSTCARVRGDDAASAASKTALSSDQGRRGAFKPQLSCAPEAPTET